MLWDGVAHRPFASEGGHASFAPNDSIGDELLMFLRRERGHVSWERVLSGMGMKNLYRFFRQRSGHAEPEWLREQLVEGDLGARHGQGDARLGQRSDRLRRPAHPPRRSHRRR